MRVHIDALGQSAEEALVSVPEEIRAGVRARYEELVAQPIRRAHVLSGTGGPRHWFRNYDPTSGYYWRRLRTYLLDHVGRSEAELESLDDSTDRILEHLEDPRPDGPQRFNVRGLALGYVQSGKTANFSALIAKAADLGYKFVIVLSGLDNGLRQQTQRRLDIELGLRRGMGVGEPEPGRRWIPLTTADLNGDFRPGTIGPNVLQGNEHVLAVVKKNKTVLQRLVDWLDRVPNGLPVLVIDDEADQASINTGGNRSPEEVDQDAIDEEADPSAINGLVRALLASFSRVSYVAYTATPFANVLINHEAIDREVWEDLYPKDFIVALPTQSGYVGAERLFGRTPLPDDPEGGFDGLDVIEFIGDNDIAALVPASREVDTFQPQLCRSLREAFQDFVLGIAGRQQRSGRDHPASMLIHTHHRKVIQNRIGDLVSAHLTELRQSWRYDRDSVRPQLRDRWNNNFRPIIASIDIRRDAPFEALEEFLDRLFRDPLEVRVLNSDSEDVLDYEVEPNLKAVLIGGNRLSRGLTLEGLLVSYYARRVFYFDTLMQMARWFGYREEYVDLTRLWTTPELAGMFRDIALAEEELRREITKYEREHLTPLDFGPKIRAHPVMLVTAANKLGSARKISQNYSGHLIQTIRFPLENRVRLVQNLSAARAFIGELGRPTLDNKNRLVWSGVSAQRVDRFLANYHPDPRNSFVDFESLRKYISVQVQQNELTRWRVAIVSQRNLVLDSENLAVEGSDPVNTISRTRLRTTPDSIGALINPATKDGAVGEGDEETGLTDEQVLQARLRYSEGEFEDFGAALRSQRDKIEGLLLIYPISKQSRPRANSRNRIPLFEFPDQSGETVIGVAVVFPASDSAATIEYVVGSVGEGVAVNTL
jgi:Z1 domain